MKWYRLRSRNGLAFAQAGTVQEAKELAERNYFEDVEPADADQADVAWLEKTGKSWVTR